MQIRNVPLVLLLVALAFDAAAQSTVTVAEFDQQLTSFAQLSDGRAAAKVAGSVLKERAAPSDLARWHAQLKGDKAREALTAVYDTAEFLVPPLTATVADPLPTIAAQREIVTRAIDYVRQTVPRLPNLLAVRTTTRFEIATPEQLDRQERMSMLTQLRGWKPTHVYLGAVDGETLFFTGQWQFVVTYRDGSEISQSLTGANRHPPPPGLETRGEFGPILTTVLGDALKGSIRFSKWEPGAKGPVAVFNYEVPKGASHYAIQNAVNGSFDLPPYRGELAIDPEYGAIYRITLKADCSESSAALQSNISLEYGPVEIGGMTYILPLHGVAISQPRAIGATGAAGKVEPDEQQMRDAPRFLNDTTFTDYHQFRSEVKILTDDTQK